MVEPWAYVADNAELVTEAEKSIFYLRQTACTILAIPAAIFPKVETESYLSTHCIEG